MLIIIHQQSNKTHEIKSLKLLREFGEKINKNYLIIVVDLTVEHECWDNDILYIPGSNEFREFSSYYNGMLRAFELHPSCILFTNDTFFRYREFTLRKYLLIKKSREAKKTIKPSAVGEVHKFLAYAPYPFGPSNYYISTYFIFLNMSSIEIIKKTNFCIFDKSILNRDSTSGMIFNEKFRLLYPDYASLIEKSLHLGGHKVKWHSFEKISVETYGAIALKGFSIVIEHGLSKILQQNNVNLLNAISTYQIPYLRLIDKLHIMFKKYQHFFVKKS